MRTQQSSQQISKMMSQIAVQSRVKFLKPNVVKLSKLIEKVTKSIWLQKQANSFEVNEPLSKNKNFELDWPNKYSLDNARSLLPEPIEELAICWIVVIWKLLKIFLLPIHQDFTHKNRGIWDRWMRLIQTIFQIWGQKQKHLQIGPEIQMEIPCKKKDLKV